MFLLLFRHIASELTVLPTTWKPFWPDRPTGRSTRHTGMWHTTPLRQFAKRRPPVPNPVAGRGYAFTCIPPRQAP